MTPARKLILPLAAYALAACALCSLAKAQGELQIHFMYVGSGDGAVLMCPAAPVARAQTNHTSPTDENAVLEEAISKIYQGLKEAFVFPDFEIRFQHCGVSNAFSDPDITFCIADLSKGESDVRFNAHDTLTEKETAEYNRRFAPTDDHDQWNP